MLHRPGDSASRSRRSRSLRQRFRSRLRLEELEARNLLSVFAPADIRHVYGFDQTGLTGSGQTIAIIDAYHNPNIAQDLQAFDTQFNLSGARLTVATPQGQPAVDAGWAGESALDVEWAHAVAPGANLLLVEAASPSLENLLGAVQYASQQPGVSVVSLSWGASEFPGEGAYDSYFSTPGITYVASAGDSGAWFGAEWPAVSPNVVAVGGTALAVSGRSYAGETGWAGGGGGVSQFESAPAYQQGVQATGARTVPDVAYDASPGTGFAVYDATNGGWLGVGGTSAGAPQWAGLVALANEGRASAGLAPLTGSSQTLPALYQMAQTSSGTYFHDVTAGANGYRAGAGYDLTTGLGTPQAAAVVQALVSVQGSGSTLTLGTAPAAPTTPVTPTAPKAPKTTHTAHRHDQVGTTNPGTGTTPVPVTSAPVGQGTNAGHVSAGTGALPGRVTAGPVVTLTVTAGSPVLSGGGAGQSAAGTPVLPAAAAPAAHVTVGDVLSGGGGGSSLLQADDTQDNGPAPVIVPDISAPDIAPDAVPSDTRVADGTDAAAGAAVRDVYFMEEGRGSDRASVLGEAAPALKPVGGAVVALLLGGVWGEARREDGDRERRSRQ